MIYLDHAATTLPKPQCVVDAVIQAMEMSGNLGRGGHKAAQYAADIAWQCRSLASEMFDLPAENVSFVFNATHGLNIAIRSLVSFGDEVVISGFEHNAVLRPLYALNAKISVAGTKLFDPEDTIKEFEKAVTTNTKAVICTHVSNVFGYILPIEEISEICARRGVPFIVDAAQSAGVLPISVKRLRAAFVVVPGHKGLFGPQGTGLLLCGVTPKPLLFGGTGSLSSTMNMPDFLPDVTEAGTQNIHGIAGLAAGMKTINKLGLKNIIEHEKFLIDMLADELGTGTSRVFYGGTETQSGVLSVVPTNMSSELFAENLYHADFSVRAGYHCAPRAHISAGTYGAGTVRFSVCAFTTQEEIARLINFIRTQKLF